MSQYPNFQQAVLALGADDKERAKKLRVSVRTLTDIKAGRLPLQVRRLVRPELANVVAALAADALTTPNPTPSDATPEPATAAEVSAK